MQLSKETSGFSNGLMDFPQVDSAAETTFFHFYPSTVFTFCSLTKQGKNTASQILQATSLSEKKPNAQPTHFHISNKNNVTVCCISAEANFQEALQVIYSGPLTHMCLSMQPGLILSLNQLDEGNSIEATP